MALRRSPKRKATLDTITCDLLSAALDLEVFNVKQLADRAGHHWQAVSRLLRLFLLKDALCVGFEATDVRGFFKVVNITPTTRKINKAKVKSMLEKYVSRKWKKKGKSLKR
jgi:hypothetical protein